MLSLRHNAYKNSLISPSPLTQGRELKQEKDGVNPKTGEKIIIAAHNKVKFTPSKQFKERVN